MGDCDRNLAFSLGVNDLSPPFRRVSEIRGGDLKLCLTDKCYYSEARVPCYEFAMRVGDEDAGTYSVLIETDFEKVREAGNVAIEARRKFYGHDLPLRATKAVLPFLRKHGMRSILITCDAGKRAVRNTCEQLGARYLDTIETSTPGTKKDRFVLDF